MMRRNKNHHIKNGNSSKKNKIGWVRRLMLLTGIGIVSLLVVLQFRAAKKMEDDSASRPKLSPVVVAKSTRQQRRQREKEKQLQKRQQQQQQQKKKDTPATGNKDKSQESIAHTAHRRNIYNYEHLYFYNPRETGIGKILTHWLRSVAIKHRILLSWDDGRSYNTDPNSDRKAQYLVAMNQSDTSISHVDKVLKVTSLRDPVERAIAAYKVESRKDGYSVQEWIHRSNLSNYEQGNQKIWNCAENCYCKLFGGYQPGGKWDTTYFCNRAKENLESFDLILFAREIKQENYRRFLHFILNAEDIPLSRKERKVNGQFNISEEDVRLLSEMNQPDKELYDYFYNKLFHQIDFESMVYPNETITDDSEPQELPSLESTVSIEKGVALLDPLQQTPAAAVASLLSTPKQIDFNRYKHVYFYHARKAGGTTFTKWFRAVAVKHHMELSWDEGPSYEPKMKMAAFFPLLKDPNSALSRTDQVLKVTTLRPPVDRALSAYRYEGAFPAFKDQFSSVREWVEIAKMHNHARLRKKIWNCAENCYCKWFGGYLPKMKWNETYFCEKALRVLDEFEVIVFLKEVSRPAYKTWLHYIMDAQDLQIAHKLKAKGKSDLNITDDDMELLTNINRGDQKLYDALYKKRVQDVDFESMVYG